jgi:Fe(3+) dicitrate transport protein
LLLRKKIEGRVGILDTGLDTAVLLHKDSIDRQHTNDRVAMVGGRPSDTGERTDLDRNRDEALAQVVRVVGELKDENATLQGALRTEKVDYKKRNDLNGTTSSMSEWAVLPGVGLSYEQDEYEVFANVSRGATLKGPELDTRQEHSTTGEVGFRREGDFFFDVTVFETKYENLKGVCAFPSGCTNPALLDQNFEGGAAQVNGIESIVGLRTRWGAWNFENKINYTLLDARFSDSFLSDNVEWGKGDIVAGDPLPYVPSSQIIYSLDIERGPFRQRWTFAWQSEMADQSLKANRRWVEAHGVIDVSTTYDVTKQAELFFRVDNLLENAYMVSYRPFELRPGKDRALIAGLTYQF